MSFQMICYELTTVLTYPLYIQGTYFSNMVLHTAARAFLYKDKSEPVTEPAVAPQCPLSKAKVRVCLQGPLGDRCPRPPPPPCVPLPLKPALPPVSQAHGPSPGWSPGSFSPPDMLRAHTSYKSLSDVTFPMRSTLTTLFKVPSGPPALPFPLWPFYILLPLRAL